MSMVELDSESPFKRPGAVPFNWEIRPGIPKTRTQPDDDGPTLLKPPKKLSTLRMTKLPPSLSSSPAVSPFAPPPPSSFKIKPRQDSRSSGPPPAPYWRCSSARATTRDSGTATNWRRWSLLKPLLRFKKSKTRDVKNNTGLDSTTTTSSESDVFYDAETKSFSSSEESSSLSSPFRVKHNESDLSSAEKRIILMMERDRLDWDVVL